MTGHSSKSAGTSPIRSVTSIRPTRWSPRSTTGSSLILCSFISSNASPRLAPTRIRYGSRRHDLADGSIEIGLPALFKQPCQVAVGEDSQQNGVVRVLDQDRPRAAARTGQPHEDVADRLVDMGPPELAAGAHHLFNPRQLPTQTAGRMIKGEVVGREVTHLADQKRQCITHGHQHRRAGRGGQTQRACFLDWPQGDAQVGRLAQRAARPAR